MSAAANGRACAIALLAACAPARATGAQTSVWHGTVEGSANVLFGAARGRVIAGSLGASRTDSVLELRADLRTTYADARAEDGHREVTARAPRATMSLDYWPYARVSPFWFGAIESSLQQRVAMRWETGAGAKLTLQRKGDDDLSVSLALVVDRTRALRPDSATPHAVSRERWSLRFRVRRQLTDAVRLSHVTFYQPTIDRPGRYTAETNTGLAVALASKLALTATLRDRYDSEARARGARSNHDGQLLFGVKASY